LELGEVVVNVRGGNHICKHFKNKNGYAKLPCEVGDTVYIRNHNSSKEAIAQINYISTPKNGKYVLVATSDVSCNWAMEERFLSIEIIKRKYTGLKVPVKAIRVKDGKTGVYTVVDGIVHFKEVNIYHKNNKYAIVEENNTANGGLLLYDEVITSSARGLKEGSRIRQ
jgi:hypothetical protein